MFSHIHWRALSPNVRDALLFGLVAALVLCSLSARQAIAAPQAATRDPQSLQFLAGALAAMGGNSISQLQLGVLALGTLRAAPGGNSGQRPVGDPRRRISIRAPGPQRHNRLCERAWEPSHY